MKFSDIKIGMTLWSHEWGKIDKLVVTRGPLKRSDGGHAFECIFANTGLNHYLHDDSVSWIQSTEQESRELLKNEILNNEWPGLSIDDL